MDDEVFYEMTNERCQFTVCPSEIKRRLDR
jgi:hypothetical protein